MKNQHFGHNCDAYLVDKVSASFMERLRNIPSWRNIDSLLVFINRSKPGEGSLFDSISYTESLIEFDGVQLRSIFYLAKKFITGDMSGHELEEIFENAKIPMDFKRVFFRELYVGYLTITSNEYAKLHQVVQSLTSRKYSHLESYSGNEEDED